MPVVSAMAFGEDLELLSFLKYYIIVLYIMKLYNPFLGVILHRQPNFQVHAERLLANGFR